MIPIYKVSPIATLVPYFYLLFSRDHHVYVHIKSRRTQKKQAEILG